jgi:hypothetical protein
MKNTNSQQVCPINQELKQIPPSITNDDDKKFEARPTLIAKQNPQ